MVGGLPAAQPYYPYQYPAPAYAQPQGYAQQQPAARPTAPRPAPATQQAAARPAAPVVRGQSPDEAPARPVRSAALKLEMPPPEALGVPVPAAAVDWTDLRLKLDRLGATRFALEQVDGGYRFTCQVPAADGRARTVEGRAATEAAAVQRALDQAGR